MKHERLKILELLEAGKITAEEATKLLEAIKKTGKECEGFHAFTFDGETAENVEEKLVRLTKGLDHFAREVGGKVEDLYKGIEPKLKKASQTVLEKTATVLDEISKSLHETLENAQACTETCSEEANECTDECCCCDEEVCEETCAETDKEDNEPKPN